MVVAEVCSSMKYPKRCQYKHAKQKKYHVRNWAEYNEGLRRRGDLTVWFDEEAIANWKADKTGKPGGQRVYSDMAIETGLVVRMVYKLAYRQTEGFLHSIASLLGLGIEIPDYSTLCRRSRLLRKKLRIPKAASTQPIHLMIDSTGLRIHVGNARKPPKQRAWRKLHIAVDRETGNIVASELTASRARDATRVPALLTQIQAPLVSVAADSAYDKEAVYEAIEAHSPGRRTRVVIPPQRNATLSQNSNTAMQERDRHIRAIERHGRREWGNELNTELGARYSTRWLRSGCPIRTAPGDSATGTGRSAICSGPCNNAPPTHSSGTRSRTALFVEATRPPLRGDSDSRTSSTGSLRRGREHGERGSELADPRVSPCPDSSRDVVPAPSPISERIALPQAH